MMTLKEKFGFTNFQGFDALLLCVWTQPVLMLNLRGIIFRIFGESVTELFFPCIYIICILFSYKYIVRQTKIKDWLFFSCCVGYYCFCSSYYTMNAAVLDKIADIFLFQTLPFFFIGLSLNIEKSLKLLRTLSLVCIILKALSVFLFGISEVGTSTEEMESMSSSHSVLPYCLIWLWTALKDGGMRNWFITIMSVAFILSLGNRGALFGLLFFLFLYLLFFKEYKHKIRSRLSILILGIIVFFLLEKIIMLCILMYSAAGVSTRIFNLFLSGNIADDNGRNFIIDNTMDIIKNGPFWGYGLAGDRFANDGFWSHNFFVEMMATFGYYPGQIISCLLLILIIGAFIKNGKSNESTFLLLLLSTCTILLFSNSFIQFPLFFFLLGYCFKLIRTKKT